MAHSSPPFDPSPGLGGGVFAFPVSSQLTGTPVASAHALSVILRGLVLPFSAALIEVREIPVRSDSSDYSRFAHSRAILSR